MASSVGKSQILRLYKTMLRESEKFASYNFKNYTIRRIKDAFKLNKTLADTNEILKQLAYAQENLRMIRRQSVIGEMFRADKLVIENRGSETKEAEVDSEDGETKFNSSRTKGTKSKEDVVV